MSADRVETLRGHRYIRLKSGRKITFWDAIRSAESAHTSLARGISRAVKLAADDWDLERLEYRIDRLEEHVAAIRAHVDKTRGNVTRKERIALLRNTAGRTPEEADAFRRKADELERGLDDG